jgi:hypothetical protein
MHKTLIIPEAFLKALDFPFSSGQCSPWGVHQRAKVVFLDLSARDKSHSK